MLNEKYPILEFDSTSPTVIDIRKNINLQELLPKKCVLSFLGEAVKEYIAKNNCRQIGSLILETFVLPIYEINVNNERIALVHALGGGPYAAGQLEKLSAMGCTTFMVCGGCGVLETGSQCGDIYVPVSAVRDEGTSYHYVAPSREIEMDNVICAKICSHLTKHSIPFKRVKTWTTDVMYRETKDMVERRKGEGCRIVEMECASYFAVAKYKGIKLGQILYAGDDLSGKDWNSRDWKHNKELRNKVLELTISICGEI